jgi:hypothetical protein
VCPAKGVLLQECGTAHILPAFLRYLILKQSYDLAMLGREAGIFTQRQAIAVLIPLPLDFCLQIQLTGLAFPYRFLENANALHAPKRMKRQAITNRNNLVLRCFAKFIMNIY